MLERYEFVIVAIQRSAKVKARIRARTKEHLCLAIDDGVECNRKQVCNGNCAMHDQRARRQEMALPSVAARKQFRDELLRLGLRLSPQEVREFNTNNLFAQIASDLS